MIINNNSNQAKYFYDILGNIYLEYNTNYYYLAINKDDDIEFIKIENLDILHELNKDYKQTYKKINQINDEEQYSMKKKILDTIEEESEDDIENDTMY